MAHLDRTEDAVCAKLFEEQCRSLGHRFDGGIRPCLHTQGVGGAAFVTDLLPHWIQPDEIQGREEQ